MISPTASLQYLSTYQPTQYHQFNHNPNDNDITVNFAPRERGSDTGVESGASSTSSSTNSANSLESNSNNNINHGSNDNELSLVENGEKYICEICGDESDGLHFGQYSCRACAAFFRRTVSLKLEYTCKRERNCIIEKSARNMCRECRYQKCLNRGMQTSAVQHTRDGLGKRNNDKNHSTSDMPYVKIIKSHQSDEPITIVSQRSSNSDDDRSPFGNSTLSNTTLGMYTPTTATTMQIREHQHKQQKELMNQQQQQQSSQANNVLPLRSYSNVPTTTSTSAYSGNEFFLVDSSTILQLGGTIPMTTTANGNGLPRQIVEYDMNGNSKQLVNGTITSPNSAFTAVQRNDLISARAGEMRYLSSMLEGYRHFLSLQKASYAFMEGPMKFHDTEEIPLSNFGTCKKLCRIEASLIMDTVEKFFIPFNTLSPADKNLLFDSFYCLFSNTERAYRTYKAFGAGDDRLLMPDGGYVRLSELTKFYKNNTVVVGDPNQVAKIFENAMEYIVKVVVTHMRRINLSETELMALFGLFIWKDADGVSEEGLQIMEKARDCVLTDLHSFYRLQGFAESEITVKSANFLLLMPKLEHLTIMMREDYDVAIMFELIDVVDLCPELMKELKL